MAGPACSSQLPSGLRVMSGFRAGSWLTTTTPSFVMAESISRVVTPSDSARAKAGSVFSGASPRAPRWPCISSAWTGVVMMDAARKPPIACSRLQAPRLSRTRVVLIDRINRIYKIRPRLKTYKQTRLNPVNHVNPVHSTLSVSSGGPEDREAPAVAGPHEARGMLDRTADMLLRHVAGALPEQADPDPFLLELGIDIRHFLVGYAHDLVGEPGDGRRLPRRRGLDQRFIRGDGAVHPGVHFAWPLREYVGRAQLALF